MQEVPNRLENAAKREWSGHWSAATLDPIEVPRGGGSVADCEQRFLLRGGAWIPRECQEADFKWRFYFARDRRDVIR
jgi:hypothetical protein